MHILEKIVLHKRAEVEQYRLKTPIAELERAPYFSRTCNSYTTAINNDMSSGVIAEFKRKSPSRSNINLTADLTQVTAGYSAAGANAISVLTDEHFFGGDNDYLTSVRQSLPEMPLLRKDFVIDEYQVIEAKAIGADIILLICEVLTADEVKSLARLARSVGLEVLLEMHTSDQISKYNDDISIVGVNNRDLKTFSVDYERSKKLFDLLPPEVPKIAESGLSSPDTCVMLYEHGFRGFLIGEQFMKQDDPGAACNAFISNYMSKRKSK